MAGERYRCPMCGRWPTTRSDGTLTPHRYAWPHDLAGKACPGSRTVPSQRTLLEELADREAEIRAILDEEPPLA